MAKVTLTFKNKILKVYHFHEGTISIGSNPDCSIQIDSLAVSPHHLDIILGNNTATLKVIDQANKVLVNDITVSDKELNEGDIIQVGKHTLSYSEEQVSPDALQQTESHDDSDHAGSNKIGWLQVMSGSNFGRSLPLKRGVTRIGKAGSQTAAIARRNGGYYISHLEGDNPPKVDGKSIGDETYQLHEGNIVTIGNTQMQFYLDDE